MIPLLLTALGAYLIGDSQRANQTFAKGGKVKLLAPNGKPSNLTPEQWHLVRTPAFKKWFGYWENNAENASKVVDENGEPLVCFHGTKERFSKFSTRYSAQGVLWFTSNKNKILAGESGAASSKYIIEVFIKADKIAGWDEYEKYGLGQIESMGYSAIKLDDDYVVFNPKNVKIIPQKKENPKTIYYHGTDENIEVFDIAKSKKWNKFGIFFTSNKELAETFGGDVKAVHLKISNPKTITQVQWNNIRDLHAKDSEWFAQWKSKLINEGYDSLKVKESKEMFGGSEVVNPEIIAVFSNNQIEIIK